MNKSNILSMNNSSVIIESLDLLTYLVPLHVDRRGEYDSLQHNLFSIRHVSV